MRPAAACDVAVARRRRGARTRRRGFGRLVWYVRARGCGVSDRARMPVVGGRGDRFPPGKGVSAPSRSRSDRSRSVRSRSEVVGWLSRQARGDGGIHRIGPSRTSRTARVSRPLVVPLGWFYQRHRLADTGLITHVVGCQRCSAGVTINGLPPGPVDRIRETWPVPPAPAARPFLEGEHRRHCQKVPARPSRPDRHPPDLTASSLSR